MFGWNILVVNFIWGGFVGYSWVNSNLNSNKPPSHAVPSGPSMNAVQWRRFPSSGEALMLWSSSLFILARSRINLFYAGVLIFGLIIFYKKSKIQIVMYDRVRKWRFSRIIKNKYIKNSWALALFSIIARKGALSLAKDPLFMIKTHRLIYRHNEKLFGFVRLPSFDLIS